MNQVSKLLIAITAAFSFSASAGTLYCKGEILNVAIYDNGALGIKSSWRNDYTHVCNLSEKRGNIQSQVCFAYMSLLLNAEQNNLTVRLSYENTEYTCQTLPTYGNAPTPFYVEQIDAKSN